MKIENMNTFNFEGAFRGLTGGYRNKNKKYEAFVSEGKKSISLGTHKTEENAKLAVYNYRVQRFIDRISCCGEVAEDLVKVVGLNYFISKSGKIFNILGHEMEGMVSRCGYRQLILTDGKVSKNYLAHRVILLSFSPIGDYSNLDVNHIDGNKLNNKLSNLEWCTRSENIIHSFKNGLQDNVAGVPIYSDEEKEFIKLHLYDSPKDLSNIMKRNKDTIRHYQYKFREENNNVNM